MAAWRSTLRAVYVRPQYCSALCGGISLQRAPQIAILRPSTISFHSAQRVPRLQEVVSAKTFHTSLSACSVPEDNVTPPPQKPGLIQRFKQMYRDYWYVLVPVHLVTSAVWMGGFYYMVRSGVDIIAVLESMGVSDRFVSPLRDSKAGYFALTYACYKVATPLRYTVTIGGTTLAINRLTAMGWIKPVPSRERLREMYQEKKEGFQDAYEETKQEIKQKTEKMKERHSQVMDDLKRYKQEMKELKKQEVKK